MYSAMQIPYPKSFVFRYDAKICAMCPFPLFCTPFLVTGDPGLVRKNTLTQLRQTEFPIYWGQRVAFSQTISCQLNSLLGQFINIRFEESKYDRTFKFQTDMHVNNRIW